MTNIGGEGWWNRKKTELSMAKEDARKKEANREAKEKEDAYKYRDAQIRRHMGFIKYHLMAHQRKKYYEIYPLPKKYRLLEQAEANKKKAAARKVHPEAGDDDSVDRAHWN